MPRARPIAAVALGVALLTGCAGYGFVRYGGGLGAVRRVAVEPLRNESYEPGVEALVTDALLRELARRRGVSVVREPQGADLVLSGAVLPLVTRPQSFSSVELSLEFELQMSLRLQARRPDGSVVPISPGLLTEFELYLASADVEIERKNRDEALRRLAGLMATRIHDGLAETLATP